MVTPVYPVLVLNVQSPSLKKKGILGRLSLKHLLRKVFPKMSHLKMQDSQRSSQHPTMTSTSNSQSFGPPPPIIKLTMEQEFKMRRIEDALNNPDTKKEDMITVFLALQRQCFVLGNNMNQLLKQWQNPPLTTPEGK